MGGAGRPTPEDSIAEPRPGTVGVGLPAVPRGVTRFWPGHPAGEPLTDLEYPHEVVNGRPPACRAQNSLRDFLHSGLLQLRVGWQPLEGRVLLVQLPAL